MKNKKMWNKIFFRDLSNFNLKKKERDEKKRVKKKKKKPKLFLIIVLLHEPNNSTCGLPFVSIREISDMILIIRKNIFQMVIINITNWD